MSKITAIELKNFQTVSDRKLIPLDDFTVLQRLGCQFVSFTQMPSPALIVPQVVVGDVDWTYVQYYCNASCKKFQTNSFRRTVTTL